MAACNSCPLRGRPTIDKPLPEKKQGGVLFVGSFPDEGSTSSDSIIKKPQPFNGRRTVILRQIIDRVLRGLPFIQQKQVMYSYACLCNPEFDRQSRKYAIAPADFGRCSVILKSFIDLQKPDKIVALGSDVYRALGLPGTVASRRGRPASYKTLDGTEIPVVCSFDLYTIFKQPGLVDLLKHDVRMAFYDDSDRLADNEAIVVKDPDAIIAELNKMYENVDGAGPDDLGRRVVAFDTETTSLMPELPEERLTVMSFSNMDHVGLAFPYMHRAVRHSDADLARIRRAAERVLTHPKALIATANGGFDMKWAWSRSIACKDHDWDVLLAEHCLDENKQNMYKLKEITRFRLPKYGNYEDELTQLLRRRWNEKEDEIKAIVAGARDSSSDNLAKWWLSLESDKAREDLLANWVKRGVVPLKDVAGLSSVGLVKRKGEMVPSKKYLASVLKVLKRVPEKEFPEGALVKPEIPEELYRRTYEDIEVDKLLWYAAMDTICTRLIMFQQLAEFRHDEEEAERYSKTLNCPVPPVIGSFENISMPLSLELARMELHGIRFDRERAKEFKEIIDAKTSEVEDRIFDSVGYRFNPKSSSELCKVLYGDLALPVLKKTASGTASTEEAVLEDLYDQHRDLTVIGDILDYRKLTKTSGTYIKNWLEESGRDGYIHCEFKQTGTVTYRLSSKEPNLQNVPFALNLPGGGFLNLKSLFLPDEGYEIYDLDIKNAEMRVLCAYSQDSHLIAAFNDGKDLHSLTAAGISGLPYEQICQFKEDKTRPEYKQRQVAKKVNFGTIYCMGANTLKSKLWQDCRIDVTSDQAREYLASFFKTYPGVEEYIRNTEEFMDDNKFVYTFFGRKRRFPYANYLRSEANRMHKQAVNARIQGTSSDMVMLCLIRLNKYLRSRNDGSCVLLTVHDSIPFQAPVGSWDGIKDELDRLIVEETAKQCPWLPVRWEYDCGWGPNYGDTHGEIR